MTNNYHMPRSLLEMRRLLAKARLEPYPVVNSRLDGGGWMVKPEALRVLFTEYLKYLAAVARGVVVAQLPNAPRRPDRGQRRDSRRSIRHGRNASLFSRMM